MKRTLIKVTFFAAILMILGGCATVEQLNEVRAIAENAQSAAKQCGFCSKQCGFCSGQRHVNGQFGGNGCSQAQPNPAADAANACCNENSSKLDRMFEKAMQK